MVPSELSFRREEPSPFMVPFLVLSLVVWSSAVGADDLDSRLPLPLLIQRLREADETPTDSQSSLRGLIVQGGTDEVGGGGGRGSRLFSTLQRGLPDGLDQLEGFVVRRNDDIGLTALSNIINPRKRNIGSSSSIASRFVRTSSWPLLCMYVCQSICLPACLHACVRIPLYVCVGRDGSVGVFVAIRQERRSSNLTLAATYISGPWTCPSLGTCSCL